MPGATAHPLSNELIAIAALATVALSIALRKAFCFARADDLFKLFNTCTFKIIKMRYNESASPRLIPPTGHKQLLRCVELTCVQRCKRDDKRERSFQTLREMNSSSKFTLPES